MQHKSGPWLQPYAYVVVLQIRSGTHAYTEVPRSRTNITPLVPWICSLEEPLILKQAPHCNSSGATVLEQQSDTPPTIVSSTKRYLMFLCLARKPPLCLIIREADPYAALPALMDFLPRGPGSLLEAVAFPSHPFFCRCLAMISPLA